MPLILNGQERAHFFYQLIKSAPLPTLQPHLVVILIGDDAASLLYVKKKKETAESLGFKSQVIHFDNTTPELRILSMIDDLNQDPNVHGILIQLPLPPPLCSQTLLDRVDPKKDVDGLNSLNAGFLLTKQPGFVPCTPLGCLDLIHQWKSDLAGCHAVVIGQSTLVGKPLDFLLLKAGCTVTMAHSRTRNLAALARSADIVISAVGRPEFITRDWIAPGACVIDVGINLLPNGRLVGDVDFQSVAEVAGAITPVPGGVGPLTVAYLMVNTFKAYCQQKDIFFRIES